MRDGSLSRADVRVGGMTDSDLPVQVGFAVSQFAPYKGFEWKWDESPIDSNYDPSADLSATLHTVVMATVSSPIQIALYHKGEYVGQGTPEAGAFIQIRHEACADDTVAVQIKIPGDSHVDTKSRHDVEYIWQPNGSVVWSGDWPFDDYAPLLPGWRKAD